MAVVRNTRVRTEGGSVAPRLTIPPHAAKLFPALTPSELNRNQRAAAHHLVET